MVGRHCQRFAGTFVGGGVGALLYGGASLESSFAFVDDRLQDAKVVLGE